MRRGALLLLLAAAGLAPAPLRAAPPLDNGTWSVEDSEEVRSRIEEADRLLARGLGDRAAPLLQEVLDRFPDHLVRDPEDGLRFEGARSFVRRRIRSLSPEARRAYEEAVGARAAEEVERAARNLDAAGLERAAERYLLAGPAGPRALLALADLRLARGEPGRAAGALRILMAEFPGTPFAGPPVAARLARALGRAGDAEALRALKAAYAAGSGERVRCGGSETTLGAVLDEALAAAGPGPRPADTPTLGGDRRRRGLGVPAEELGIPRWTEPNGARFQWTARDHEQWGRETRSVGASLSAAQPVAAALVDGVVYAHWSFDLLARDLYTGRERWRFRVPTTPRVETARTHGSILLCPAVADGVVFAPLQTWPLGDVPRDIRFAGQDIIPQIPVRRLYAVDASTGREVWSHADPRPAGDPFADRLRYLNVTSAPLVAGNLVFAAGAAYRGQFSAWAFASDRRTGEVRWMTRLGYGQQELNLFGRTVKEVPVASVASDGERLFILSNMGFVSCLEASSGRPLWTRGYRQMEVPLYDNLWTTPERDFTWSGSPPVVSRGLVLAAPADGPDLLALKADTGEVRWAFPYRDGPRYDSPRTFRLLGADEDRAYVAGTSVRALDLVSGKIVWETPFPGERGGEASGGRGVIADGKLFVPSTRGLYVLDARDRGKILRADAHPRAAQGGRAGGNLVATEGAAVLVRLNEMEGYYRAEDVRARALALVRERPGNPDALLEAARIYLAADRPDDALPLLQQALQAARALPAPEGDRRGAEVRACLLAAREARARALLEAGKTAEAKAAWTAAADEAPSGAAAAAALLRGAQGLQQRGRFDLAAPLLEKVAAAHPDEVLEGEEQLLDRDIGRNTAASYALFYMAVWDQDPARAAAGMQRIIERPATDLLFGSSAREIARQYIEQLLRRQGEAVYAPFERLAGEALARARGGRDPSAFAAVVERWPNSRAARRAALEEGRLRLEAGDGAGAVAAARRILAGRPGDGDAAAALWLLADGLLRTGKAASARAALRRLARRYPGEAIDTPAGRIPAGEAAARRLESPELRASAPEAPALLPPKGPFRALWEREAPAGETWTLLDPPGDPLPGGKVILLHGPTLAAADALTGAPAWTATRPAFRGPCVSAGGYLVFALDEEAVGIDPATGEEVWAAELPGSLVDLVAVDSTAVLLLGDLSDPDQATVLALDPATGEGVWPGQCLLPGGADRLLPLENAVLADGSGSSFPMLRVVDMAEGALRPFFIPTRHRDDLSPGEPLPSRKGPLLVLRDDSVEAYDPAGGTRLWTWRLARDTSFLSIAAGDGALVAIDSGGTLRCLDTARGLEGWTGKAGRDRVFDPSETAILADGKCVYLVTSDPGGGALRLEARALSDGTTRWTAPLSRTPALVELREAGEALLVKHLAAGAAAAGGSGVLVLDRADGTVREDFDDDRLGGEGFEAAALSGVLAVASERLILVRGK